MLTNAVAVFFCGAPLLEVQMAVFAGTERRTFNDIQRDGGNTQQLAAIAERYVRNNIRWKVILDGSLQRKEIPEIPMDAVREAIINSYCHRDYRSSQNNAIMVFSNRVEIYNPGKFPEGLTPEDFIKGSELSIKRNPLLAQLMYYVRDIESFGTGIKRISDACEAAGVKVEFEMRKLGFAVVFYRPDDAVYDGSIGESIGNNVGNNVGDSVGNNVGDSVDLSDIQKQIITIIRSNPKTSASAIATEIGIAQRNVERNIKNSKTKV